MNNTTGGKFLSNSILKEIQGHLDQQFEKRVTVQDDTEIAGWFMGTRGENLSEVTEIILSVLKSVVEGRELLFPADPNYITGSIKVSEGYKKGIEAVKEQTENLLEILNKYSLPTQSLRYQGHMLWDITLPSIVGYFAAMLQNQNNVTPQASPATTILELLACNDIAQMAGFQVKPLEESIPEKKNSINAWTHISCDGSIANIESLWAAREAKFFPLGIKYALGKDEYLHPISKLLRLPSEKKLFKDATAWELLNLKQDDILDLPETIFKLMRSVEKGITLATVWKTLTESYSLNARGLRFFDAKYLRKEKIKTPTIIVPSTKHYSWPKATATLGLGNGQKGLNKKQLTQINKIEDDGLINIYVDSEGKVNTKLLRKVLETCEANKKPVIMVVGVMGTTEEGAVDPLEKIIAIREKFRENKNSPFEFSIHADAAWGGYFITCFRNPFNMERFPTEISLDSKEEKATFDNKDSWFRNSVYKSMVKIRECDSVTIDPHKMGYIPYPAGSLTYRNDKIINLLSFTAPYISSGTEEGNGINTRNIGECGLEGSKAGAAAASVYLSHMVIRPDKRGYGKIINQSMLNSKIFYVYLCIENIRHKKENRFEIVTLDPLPSSIDTGKYLHKLWDESFDLNELAKDKAVQKDLKKIAGDQNIIDYIFVDKKDKSLKRTKELNNKIFKALSLEPGTTVQEDEIFVSSTTFHRKDYGKDFVEALAKRLYVKEEDLKAADSIPCIRSVIMDPWAIYTHGKNNYNFFKDVFIPKLREVVNTLCEQ